MKIKIKSFFFLVLIHLSGLSFGQQSSVLDAPYKRITTPDRIALPYPYLREADVMWSRRIWRVIDLNEKMNLPLKYPLGKIQDRKSLIDILLDAIRTGSLTAYDATESDEFILPTTMEGVTARGGSRIDTVKMQRPDPPYDEYDTVIVKEFSSDKVIGYRIKEDWFFDKQRSVLDVRIIGIAPLVYAVDEKGDVRPGNLKIPLFWIYYPEARQLLAHVEVFIRDNNGVRLTVEDIFQKRFRK